MSVKSITKRIQGRLDHNKKQRDIKALSKGRDSFKKEWTFTQVQQKLRSENTRYEYFLWFFANYLPKEYVAHRRYFESIDNWCGESAFHGMWFKLLEEFRPRSALEIGVHRGQTLSFWQFVADTRGWALEAWGVTPMNGSGDSVSWYGADFDYFSDISKNFSHFKLKEPNIFIGYSEENAASEFIRSRRWDLVYVDGNHDFEVVKHDVELAKASMKTGGILVLDDASLTASFDPPTFAFGGHPGPSKIADLLQTDDFFSEIGTCGHNRVFRSE